jgi:hypothetical protein
MAAGWAGCSVFVGNPNEDDETGSGRNVITLSGFAVLGYVKEAVIHVYRLGTDGLRGELLGSTTTDNEGKYSLEVEEQGPFELTAVGGGYKDEATGVEVNRDPDEELLTFSSASGDSIMINPLTTMMAYRARNTIAQGLDSALVASRRSVGNMFSLDEIDFSIVKPGDLTKAESAPAEDSPEARLGLVMAGLSQILVDNKLPPEKQDKLILALADDFADGILDGKSSDRQIETSFETPPCKMFEGYGRAVTNFTGGRRYQGGSSTAASGHGAKSATKVTEGRISDSSNTSYFGLQEDL